MESRTKPMIAGLAVWLGAAALALPARAAGFDEFKLSRAIPADATLVVQSRDHEGRKFVNEQMKRVWAAVEAQKLENDVRRLLRSAALEQGEDAASFDEKWRQITDLAAGVTWSRLCEREFAVAGKLALPTPGVDIVLLMMPPQEELKQDFDGLTAMLKGLVGLAPEGQFVLNTEGEGESVVHKLSSSDPSMTMSLTLARQKDVVLFGYGTTMVDQSLSLLRGRSPADATLAATSRFKEAFKRLPAPTDGFTYVDCAALLGHLRQFLKSIQVPGGATPDSEEAAESPLGGKMAMVAVLPKLLDKLDIYDHMAMVGSTEGMKTTSEAITALKSDAKSKPLYRILYGGAPLRDPLKFIPKEATVVAVGSGIDLRAMYKEIMSFIATDVPDGETLVSRFKQAQSDAGWDVEEDLLSWLGSGFASFTAPIPTPFMPGTVYILTVRDEAKAKAALEKISTSLEQSLAQMQGAIEDAKIEGAEGFKRIILPPLFAMMLPIGRPVYGVKDGHLFLATGPEAVAAALKVAAGQSESFAKSERFLKEGLPMSERTTAMGFQDLTKWGEQFGTLLSGIPGMLMMTQPTLAKDPTASTALNLLVKIGNVLKKFDFYRSACEVTTFDGTISATKSVIHYQEPPKRPTSGPTTGEGGSTSRPATGAPAKSGEVK